MNFKSVVLAIIFVSSSLAGCIDEANSEPNGQDCYNEMIEKELAGGATTSELMDIFSECASVELDISVNDERMYYGSTMVGLDSPGEFDTFQLELNATSIVTISPDVMTYANFNLITLNASEYNSYYDGNEFTEISELSSSCFDGCYLEYELHEGNYYVIMDLS